MPEFEEVLVRLVDGRPVSGITTRFLSWCSETLQAAGKRVRVLIWDNASWHISKEVREWINSDNTEVKSSGQGVRIISCLLPKHSPWFNPIEPKWVHGKRKVVEPDGVLGA
jgi:transposase